MVIGGKIVPLADCMVKARIPDPKQKNHGNEKIGEYVWVAYDQSRARLPVAIAFTIAELSEKTGVSVKKLLTRWYNYKFGKTKTTRCAKVYIGDDEDAE